MAITNKSELNASTFQTTTWTDAKPKSPSQLSNHSDTPLGIARFEYGSLHSFDTEVQDLIQQHPDMPIGGSLASARQENKDIVIASKSHLIESVKIISALNRPLPRAASLSSDASLQMVTAAASLRSHVGSETCAVPQSSELYAGSGTLTIPNESQAPKDAPTAIDRSCFVANLDGGQMLPCCELGEADSTSCSNEAEMLCPGPELCHQRPRSFSGGNIPQQNLLPRQGINAEQQLMATSAEAPRYNQSDALAQNGLNLPLDGTGFLPTPSTPKKRRRSRGKARFHKTVRSARAKCLKRPVMVIVVGRQLGGPVSSALCAIAGSQVPEISDITGVATSNLPAPVAIPA